MNIYKTLAHVVPKKGRQRISVLLDFASITVHHLDFIGFVTASSLLIGAVIAFFFAPIYDKPWWLLFVGGTVLVNVIVYTWIMLMVDKKAQLVEESLPDALQLTASNLRAGMTPEKALLLSSRPEFGPLKQEVDIVGKKVALGKDIGTALIDMAHRVKSKVLVRAVELINSGLSSGGSLSVLLESTSSNLREQFLVNKKIKATITMYIIFIFAAAAVISPVLFGLSSFLVEVLNANIANVDIPSTASIPISLTASGLSVEFMKTFVMTFLIANCFMAAMLLGLIVKGKPREGIRYFIPMILIAVPLFFVSRYFIGLALGGLL